MRTSSLSNQMNKLYTARCFSSKRFCQSLNSHTVLLSTNQSENILPTVSKSWKGISHPNVNALNRPYATQQVLLSTATSNKSITDESTKSKTKGRNVFQRIWDKYSLSGQQMRIDKAELLFRAAEYRAKNPVWYQSGRLNDEFRSYHSILTMHVWFLHKRLITTANHEDEDGIKSSAATSSSIMDAYSAHIIQEELFETLWADTRARIRAQGIYELTVNKHLKDAQQLTFQQCMHLDYAFTMEDPLKRREELALALWVHLFMKNEDCLNDQLNRLALYVEWQYQNIMSDLPDQYFWEGRVHWGDMPDFTQMKDNDGNLLPDIETKQCLPDGWLTNYTESGDIYYWNEQTMISQWDKPTFQKN